MPKLRKHERAFLCFEGSYYRTCAWLNEKELGSHLGGFTPLEIEITEQLQKKNVLTVLVDAARDSDRVPTTTTDWFTYGGIYRDVFIDVRPTKHIVRTFVQLDRSGKHIVGSVDATHAGVATLNVPQLKISEKLKISAGSKSGKFKIPVPSNMKRWSLDSPKLYKVVVEFGDDQLVERIGFRTIATKKGQILLNGEPVYLKGVSVHEDHISRGRSLTDKDRMDIFREAKDMGCNFLRLAHYPHSRRMAEMADRLGVLLWEEVPVYWHIEWQNKETYNDASNQLRELVLRDRNRASVILWSVANETPLRFAGRTEFLGKLSRLVKRLDPVRLVTAALFKEKKDDVIFVNDPLAGYLDVIGVNEYHGWYGETNPRAARVMTQFKNIKYPDKPVIISEFGAGAKAGHHGKEQFTEEYQAQVYKEQLAALGKCSSVKGLTPWILMDFRSPMRNNHYQDGFNLKGLVDADRCTRKKAFAVYRDFKPPVG